MLKQALRSLEFICITFLFNGTIVDGNLYLHISIGAMAWNTTHCIFISILLQNNHQAYDPLLVCNNYLRGCPYYWT